MTGFATTLRAIAAALVLLMPGYASAAAVTAAVNATGQTTILKSLSVLKKADLDFGKLAATGAGTAVIDPTGGPLTVTGALSPIGSGAHRALFTATGSRNSVVLIRLPKNPVTLTRVGGSETMTVSNWTMDGPTNRRFPTGSAFDFGVGGTLNVAAGQADGTYAGTFTVTVQYP